MLDPIYAYIISFLVLVVVVFYKKEVLYAIVIGTLTFGLLTLEPSKLPYYTLLGIFNESTYKLMASIILALYLAGILGGVGLLDKLTRGITALGYKVAATSIPALIGLIPMPGGALVSAMMVRKLYFNKLNIGREEGAFINYWFRHVWVPSWPLYQSAILAAAILHMDIFQLLSITYPASLSGILVGGVMALTILRHVEGREKADKKSLLINLWPFLLIFILGLIVKLDIIVTLGIATAVVLVYYKPNKEINIKAIKFATDPKILTILLFAMIYREYIVVSGVAQRIFELLATYNINKYLVAYAVPFIVGAVTSNEFMFAALAFPLLLNLFFPTPGLLDASALLISYTGGWLGVMFSPVHLCIVFTVEHFKADFIKTYKYIILAIAATSIVVATMIMI